MAAQLLRLAAYAVCLDDNRMLLARHVSPDRSQQYWTLPGGGVEHGEDPFDAVTRAVAEEAGCRVSAERLLGVDSRTRHLERTGGELHYVGFFYAIGVPGDVASLEWVALDQLAKEDRAVIVDIAISLHESAPPTGHVDPIPAEGLLHD